MKLSTYEGENIITRAALNKCGDHKERVNFKEWQDSLSNKVVLLPDVEGIPIKDELVEVLWPFKD